MCEAGLKNSDRFDFKKLWDFYFQRPLPGRRRQNAVPVFMRSMSIGKLADRAVTGYAARVKRSLYKIANWFIAAFQCGDGCVHLTVMLRNASHISLVAASSLGK